MRGRGEDEGRRRRKRRRKRANLVVPLLAAIEDPVLARHLAPAHFQQSEAEDVPARPLWAVASGIEEQVRESGGGK